MGLQLTEAFEGDIWDVSADYTESQRLTDGGYCHSLEVL